MRTFVLINLSAGTQRMEIPFDCTLRAVHVSAIPDPAGGNGMIWIMDAPVAEDIDGPANGSTIAALTSDQATIINTSIDNLKISLKSGQFIYLQNVDNDFRTFLTMSVDKP